MLYHIFNSPFIWTEPQESSSQAACSYPSLSCLRSHSDKWHTHTFIYSLIIRIYTLNGYMWSLVRVVLANVWRCEIWHPALVTEFFAPHMGYRHQWGVKMKTKRRPGMLEWGSFVWPKSCKSWRKNVLQKVKMNVKLQFFGKLYFGLAYILWIATEQMYPVGQDSPWIGCRQGLDFFQILQYLTLILYAVYQYYTVSIHLCYFTPSWPCLINWG